MNILVFNLATTPVYNELPPHQEDQIASKIVLPYES